MIGNVVALLLMGLIVGVVGAVTLLLPYHGLHRNLTPRRRYRSSSSVRYRRRRRLI